MKTPGAIYHAELNHFMEQSLGYVQNLVREGPDCILPFYIIFPVEGDSELHRFDFKKEKDCDHDGHSQLLDAVDIHLEKRAKKKPKMKYAVIGYTLFVEKEKHIVLEAYGEQPDGLFLVTQPFKMRAGKPSFGKEASLNYFTGHNPVLQNLGRSKMKQSAFRKGK